MGISEKIGGIPSLTAVIVVLPGVVSAALGRFVFNGARREEPRRARLRIGLAGHGQGVAGAVADRLASLELRRITTAGA